MDPGVRKLSISLSVNLSEDGDMQRADGAAVGRFFAQEPESRRGGGERRRWHIPGDIAGVPRARQGFPGGGDRDAGELGEEEDGDEPAAAPDKLASLQDKDSSCIRGQRMGCYG